MNNISLKRNTLRRQFLYIAYEYLRLIFGFLSIAFLLLFFGEVSKIIFFSTPMNSLLAIKLGFTAFLFSLLWYGLRKITMKLAKKLQ